MKTEKLGARAKHLDEPYLPLLQEIDFTPVFIIGDRRSGTTLLYQLLAASECFNFVSAYHIIKYEELIFNFVSKNESHVKIELDRLFEKLNLIDRKIDEVKISPDLPEEYGFILDRTKDREPKITENNFSLFLEICQKIQFISDRDKLLLLKNPWDFSNFIFIKQMLPKAKFIFIHRHPVYVINSQLKMARSLLKQQNIYAAMLCEPYRHLFEKPLQLYVCRFLFSTLFGMGLRNITKAAIVTRSYFLRNIDLLPKTDYISIRYEDLCEHPDSNVMKILSFFGLEQKSTLTARTLLAPRPLNLLPEVAKNSDRICDQLQSYLSYLDYSLSL
ncbi:sulfotransferase family protein [Merismopedia glauca]|uniref:Sulfotransferase n=2 Tax=Merismopedia TaxID=53402 RepID=A0A2T1BZT4_9CYAN|nr:sulfotransferase [Merismopedia glauca]PSB01535.1 sulfotransferase [Merismopedia glauca CCAP 1448/3]